MINTIIWAILSMFLTSAVAYGWHSVEVSGLQKEYEKKLTAEENQCMADKALTEKVSHEYQNQISALNARVADLRRLRPDVCVAITGTAASGYVGPSAKDKPVGQGVTGHPRIDYYKLIDRLQEGEKYRLQLIECQSFVGEKYGK